MRTRNNRISLYLDDKEMERFNRKVKQAGLNRSIYLRQLIEGYGPTPLPDERFWNAMETISEFSDKISEIALKAGKPEDIIEIMKEARAWRSLRNEIEKYFLRPKEIDLSKVLADAANNNN